MEKKKSIKVNFVFNIILTASSFIFPLITFPYASRILGAEGLGKVSFATSLISYFTMFSQLGVPTYGIKMCARVRDDKIELSRVVHELLFIRLITTVITYVALAIVLAVTPRLQADKPLYCIVGLNIFFTYIGAEWLYKGLEKYAYITTRSLIFKCISILALFAFIKKPSDYVAYGAISIFAGSASNIFNFFNLRKSIILKPVGSYCVKRHIKPILTFFLLSCASYVYTHMDTLMLGFLASDVDVGYYSAATKIKTILVSVVTSLGAVLLPRASYYINKGMYEEFKRIAKKALEFVCLAGGSLSLYFSIYAANGIHFLAGKSYDGAVMPMVIIMPTLLLIGMTNIMGIQMLVPLGKEKCVIWSELAGVFVNLIANSLLIPRIQSSGAAIGTVLAELSVFLVQLYFLKDLVIPMFKDMHLYKIILALVLAGVGSSIVKLLGAGDFTTLALSASLFYIVYGMVLLITKEKLFMEILDIVLSKVTKHFKKYSL